MNADELCSLSCADSFAAIQAANRICSLANDDADSMVAAGVSTTLADILRIYQDHAGAVFSAMAALSAVCFFTKSPEVFRTSMMEAGAASLLVMLARKYLDDEKMSEYFAKAINFFAAGSIHRQALVDADFCFTLVCILRRHSNNKCVAQYTCKALVSFVKGGTEVRNALVAAGVIPALNDVVHHHLIEISFALKVLEVL